MWASTAVIAVIASYNTPHHCNCLRLDNWLSFITKKNLQPATCQDGIHYSSRCSEYLQYAIISSITFSNFVNTSDSHRFKHHLHWLTPEPHHTFLRVPTAYSKLPFWYGQQLVRNSCISIIYLNLRTISYNPHYSASMIIMSDIKPLYQHFEGLPQTILIRLSFSCFNSLYQVLSNPLLPNLLIFQGPIHFLDNSSQ